MTEEEKEEGEVGGRRYDGGREGGGRGRREKR